MSSVMTNCKTLWKITKEQLTVLQQSMKNWTNGFHMNWLKNQEQCSFEVYSLWFLCNNKDLLLKSVIVMKNESFTTIFVNYSFSEMNANLFSNPISCDTTYITFLHISEDVRFNIQYMCNWLSKILYMIWLKVRKETDCLSVFGKFSCSDLGSW